MQSSRQLWVKMEWKCLIPMCLLSISPSTRLAACQLIKSFVVIYLRSVYRTFINLIPIPPWPRTADQIIISTLRKKAKTKTQRALMFPIFFFFLPSYFHPQVIRLTVFVTDTTAPVLQQGKGLLIITIIDINEQPPVSIFAFSFFSFSLVAIRLTFSFVIFSLHSSVLASPLSHFCKFSHQNEIKELFSQGLAVLRGTLLSIKILVSSCFFNFLILLPTQAKMWEKSRKKNVSF